MDRKLVHVPLFCCVLFCFVFFFWGGGGGGKINFAYRLVDGFSLS